MKNKFKVIIMILFLFLLSQNIIINAQEKKGWIVENGITYYYDKYENKGKWWNQDEKGVFYLQEDGSIKNGLQEINGIMYYIENNYIYYGEKEINNEMYVFQEITGELKTGSVRLQNGELIYVEKDGKHHKDGWFESNGNKYYQKDSNILEGFQKIDNKTYYFEKDTGKLKQWWNRDEKGVFYLQADGSIKNGLQEINGIMYYIENNYIYYGEKEINNEMYVFQEITGELKTGSVRLQNGELIYVEKDGKHHKDGWFESNGNKYYQKDSNILEGFQKIDNKTYYFEKDTGKLKQWWNRDEKGVFYLQADGSIKNGLQEINGIMYYIENNYIYYGEKEINNEMYVFQEITGELKTGIIKLSNDNIIYVEKNGNHKKGWIYYNDKIYYINSIGIAITDKQIIDGREYCFNKNGEMSGFYWNNNKLFYKNPDGTQAKGVQYMANNFWKFNELTGEFEKFVRQIRVIDISSHNGNIDWQTVKNSNLVDAVILRLGYGVGYIDSSFIKNKNELERLGIPYSVYLFSYAENANEALMESNFLVNTIRSYNIHIASNILGIYYDLEDWTINSTGENSYGISKDTYGQMITTFINNTEKNLCIKTRVYASKNYIETRFPDYAKNYATWIAQWGNNITYQGPYDGWQYTSSGTIPGIDGRVDISVFYT